MIIIVLQPYILEVGFDSAILLGIAITCATLAGTFPQAGAGMLADRFGDKKIIILGDIISVVGLVVLLLPINNYLVVVLGILLLDGGGGAANPPYQTMIAESYALEKHGRAFSIIQVAGNIAGIMAPIIVSALFMVPTQFFFLLFLLFMVVAVPIRIFGLRDAKGSPRTDKLIIPKLRARNRLFGYSIIVLVLDALIWGVSFSIYFGMLTLTYPFVGRDQLGGRQLAAVPLDW